MVHVSRQTRARGQLVLIAALALVVALVPLVFAYLQLGYHDDFRPEEPADVAGVERTLDRSLHDAVAATDGRHSWARRGATATTIRDSLNTTIADLERAGLADGAVTEIRYNETLASRWAARHCPGGPDRQFGPCEADRGVVVQQRLDQTYVLAVAVDVRATTETSQTHLQTVLAVRTG